MRITRKKIVVIGIVAASLMGGSALAYWSTTGSGTGTAAVGSSNGTVSLKASVGGSAIVPGESRSVTFTASNAGSSNLFVGTISLDSVTVDAAHDTCDVADFTMPAVASNSTVAAGATDASIAGTGTLSFANTSANQDACKGATVTLNLKSN